MPHITQLNAATLKMLSIEVKKTSISAVAKRIGYNRTSLSLAFHGKYPGRVYRLEAAILKHLTGNINCPYLGDEITIEKCDENSSRSMPTSSPFAFKHWQACQGCLLNKANSKSVTQDNEEIENAA